MDKWRLTQFALPALVLDNQALTRFLENPIRPSRDA